MQINSYRDLLAWQKGIELTEAIYRISKCFPPEQLYGLTNQVRRAAVSIPSNITEGAGRNTSGEFVQSVGHSRSSLFELETQLIVAERVRYLSQSELRPVFDLTDEIGRLTAGLIRSLSGQRIG